MRGQVLDFFGPDWESQLSQAKADLKDYKGELLELDKIVRGIKFNPGDGAKAAMAQTEQLRKANEDLRATANKINDALTRQQKLSIDNAKAMEVEAKAALNNAKAKTEEAKARDQNASAALKEQKQREADAKAAREYAKSVQDGLRELEKLEKQRAASAERAAKIEAQSNAREKRLAESQAAKENAASLRQLQRESQALKRQMDAELKETQLLQNAYYRLNKEHQALFKEAQRLGAEFGIESKEFQEAAARANELDQRLKQIDSALGRNTRYVGEYTRANGNLRNSISQFARELPNAGINLETFILSISNQFGQLDDAIKGIRTENAALLAQGKPQINLWKEIGKSIFSTGTLLQIGIAILITYRKEISDFFSTLFKGRQSLTSAAAAFQSLNDGLKDSSFAEAIKNVNELKTNIDLAKQGLIDKKVVLDQYNESIGKTTGKVNSLDQAEQALVKNTPDYLRMMLLKAAAQNAYTKAAEAAVEAEVDVREGYDDLNKAVKDGALGNAKWNSNPFGMFTLLTASNKVEGSKAKRENAKTLEEIAADFQKQAAEISSKHKWNFFEPDKEETKKQALDLTDEILSANQRAFTASQELEKNQLESANANLEAIFKNEKLSLERRLDAYKTYTENIQALDAFDTDTQLKEKNAKLDQIEAIEKRIGKVVEESNLKQIESWKGLSNEEKKLLVEKFALENERVKIVSDSATKIEQRVTESQKEILSIMASSDSQYLRMISQRLQKVEESFSEQYQQEIDALNKSLLAKEISVSEYEKRRKKIENDSMRDRLQQQISELQFQLDNSNLSTDVRAKLEKDLSDYKKKLGEEDVQNAKTVAQEIIRIENEKRDAIISIGKSLYDTVFAIQKGRLEKENQDDDREKEQLEKDSKKRIDDINAQAISEQEKQILIRREEINTENERARIEERQRQRNIKIAKAEKERAIMNIILDTAQAVIKAWTEGDPASKWFRAAAAGSAGLAQLAAAIAAPLPQYEEGAGPGLGNPTHPGGSFIAGDGGQRELIQEPSGRMYWSNPFATLYSAPAGTTVTPEKKLMDRAHANAVRQMLSSGASVTPQLYAETIANSFQFEMDKAAARIEKAVSRIPQTKFFMKNGEWRKVQENSGSVTRFLDDLI